MAAATVAFIVIDLLRLRLNPFKNIFIILFGSLLRRREFTSLTGGSYLMLAALVCMVIFGNNDGVFIAAISFLAVGDTVAAIVGLSVGRVRIFRKTLEGTLAGLAACVGVAYLVSVLGLDLPFRIGILGAVSASLVEALPVEVNDNVVVPIFSGAVMMVALQVWH
jgi:glycerol-3-phosphate acyltransferase PlsY